MAETTLAEVMAELAALEDPKAREVNEKHGDDHGVILSMLRALAKRLKTQQELARQLWETADTAARLPAEVRAHARTATPSERGNTIDRSWLSRRSTTHTETYPCRHRFCRGDLVNRESWVPGG